MNKIVAASDRIYRLILNIYPQAFRDEYGEEMAQTMRDQVRDAWADRRMLGVIVLWLKVLVDTARSALVEHLKQRSSGSFSLRGLVHGLATAIGFPLAFVSFANPIFWSTTRWAGDPVGFQAANDWELPAIGFVLAGVGLHGFYKRLEMNSTFSIAAVWVGVALGLEGLAGRYFATALGNDFFAWHAISAAFILLTLGMAAMGRIALRKKTFGALSFVPLAVVASGGLWFLVTLLVTGVYERVAESSAVLIHVSLWITLGVLLWAYPRGNAVSVRATLGTRVDEAQALSPSLIGPTMPHTPSGEAGKSTDIDPSERTEPPKQHPNVLIVIVLAALGAIVWYLNSPAIVEVADVEMVSNESVVTATVNTCGGDLSVDVYEVDSLVSTTVFDHRFRLKFGGNDCQDVIQERLSVPLGGRMLVDGSTGRALVVPDEPTPPS